MLKELARSPKVSGLLLFVLSVLVGWCVFNLQTLSLVGLLQEVGMNVLPGLLLFQALCSYVFLHFMSNTVMSSSHRFFASAIFIGFAVTLMAHWNPVGVEAWHLFAVLFVMAQLTISALRMGIHVTLSKQISVLRNPQISIQLAVAEESGFLIGVVTLFAFPNLKAISSQVISSLPFFLAASVFILLSVKNRTPLKNILPDPRLIERLKKVSQYFRPLPKSSDSKEEFRVSIFSPTQDAYLKPLIALFAVVALLKSLQWFGMAYGLSLAVSQGQGVVNVFSRLSLIQSVLTLSILLASLRFAKRIPAWSTGFRVLLSSQGIASIVLSIFSIPALMMGGEVVRKVLEHGFLGRSLQLLTSSIPDEKRLETRHLMERWSVTTGTALAAVVSFFVINGYLPIFVMWIGVAGLALYGLKLRKKLFATLCDFHLAHLGQDRLSSVIQACQVLAHPESKNHYAALTGLLERKPRPIIVKNILHTLGQMRHPLSWASIERYLGAEREDIQIAAIRAAQNFKGHETNLRLLKLLRDVCRADMAIRSSVVSQLTQRLGRLAIPYLLELLERPQNERITANAVEILGEIAVKEKDNDLMDFLTRFLSDSHPRRVRANAAVVLYGHPVHGAKALEVFDRFMTSADPKEFGSFAYVAGVLNLTAHGSVIWKLSCDLQHQDSTLLVSLLRLGNPDAAKILVQWILGENDKKANEVLVRLSAVPYDKRSSVFFELIENHAQLLELALLRMRKSQRDFDYDRELIRQEAHRIGLELTNEGAWFAQSEETKKAA